MVVLLVAIQEVLQVALGALLIILELLEVPYAVLEAPLVVLHYLVVLEVLLMVVKVVVLVLHQPFCFVIIITKLTYQTLMFVYNFGAGCDLNIGVYSTLLCLFSFILICIISVDTSAISFSVTLSITISSSSLHGFGSKVILSTIVAINF